MPRTIRFCLPVALAVCVAACVGCTSFESLDVKRVFKRDDARVEFADAKHPALDAICMWSVAEGRNTNGIPTRGFSGRILFMDARRLPVAVKGKVRIYLFDDQGTLEEQSKPIHQFDFTPDAWNTHLLETPMGPAYQVFIPYQKRNSAGAKCALQLRMTPVAGPIVFSDMTEVKLPGSKDDFEEALTKTKESQRPETREELENFVADRLSNVDGAESTTAESKHRKPRSMKTFDARQAAREELARQQKSTPPWGKLPASESPQRPVGGDVRHASAHSGEGAHRNVVRADFEQPAGDDHPISVHPLSTADFETHQPRKSRRFQLSGNGRTEPPACQQGGDDDAERCIDHVVLYEKPERAMRETSHADRPATAGRFAGRTPKPAELESIERSDVDDPRYEQYEPRFDEYAAGKRTWFSR